MIFALLTMKIAAAMVMMTIRRKWFWQYCIVARILLQSLQASMFSSYSRRNRVKLIALGKSMLSNAG